MVNVPRLSVKMVEFFMSFLFVLLCSNFVSDKKLFCYEPKN